MNDDRTATVLSRDEKPGDRTMSYNPAAGTVAAWARRIAMAVQGDPDSTAALNEVTGRPDTARILAMVDMEPAQLVSVLQQMVDAPDSWAPKLMPGDPGYNEFETKVIGLLLLVAQRIRHDMGR